ncbi:MAG TPA: alpha/beta hydrolase [Thermoanaerobaculia bacterium]|nr:alpha/beta hydrolase [Thermoanaerobaculia bacterium]
MNLESIWYGPSPDRTPTLVFLHEGLGSATMWRDFPRRLSEVTGYGALVYSRAGYGSSDPAPLPRPIRYMHDEAAMLDDILAQHEIRESILIGHSDGGSIALIYAGNRPKTPLRAMILEAPHVSTEPGGLASIARMKIDYETTGLRERLARYHKDVDNAFRGWNDVWLHPDFRAWNIEEYLSAIRVPMLLIQGEDDEYGTGKQIEAIEAEARGPIETLRVPSCGHSPHRDQPEIVLQAMMNFVTKV